jgi:hypothetical protein
MDSLPLFTAANLRQEGLGLEFQAQCAWAFAARSGRMISPAGVARKKQARKKR